MKTALATAFLLWATVASARPSRPYLPATATVHDHTTVLLEKLAPSKTVVGNKIMLRPKDFRPSDATRMLVEQLTNADGIPGAHPQVSESYSGGRHIVLDTAILHSQKAHEVSSAKDILKFAADNPEFSVTTHVQPGHEFDQLKEQLRPFGLHDRLTSVPPEKH